MRRDLALIVLAAAAACFTFGRAGQPIHGDRAYHVYMAQTVLRGDALYGATTYGYTPYTPLLTSVAMRALAPFGVPSYLAPRFLGVALLIALAMLLYLIARRASDARTALIAALTLCGFGHLAMLSVIGTEPVVLVALFMLLAIYAQQREWWFVAGCAVSAAAMTWQPAIVVCIAALVLARRRMIFIAGAVVAAIPAAIYVLPHLDAFLFQTIQRKIASADLNVGASWLLTGVRSYWTDALVLLLGAIGFVVALVHRKRDELPLLAMTIAWGAWFAIYFWAVKDLVPALPLIAYWSSRFCVETAALGRRPILLALYLAIAFTDVALYRPFYTLDDQLRDVRTSLGPARNFLAFGAEEFYVLTETRAPVRTIRMARWADVFIDPRSIATLHPEVIILRDVEGPSRLQTALEAHVRDWPRTVVSMPYTHPVDHLPPEMQPTIVYHSTRSRPLDFAR